MAAEATMHNERTSDKARVCEAAPGSALGLLSQRDWSQAAGVPRKQQTLAVTNRCT